MKKTMNLLILSIILGLVSPILIFANDPASVANTTDGTISGTVPAVNQITIYHTDSDMTDNLVDMHTGPQTDKLLFRYQVSNNHRDGWSVTFTSQHTGDKAGKLVLFENANDTSTSYGDDDGEFITYKLTTEASASQPATAIHGYFDTVTAANTGAANAGDHNLNDDVLTAGPQSLTYNLADTAAKASITATYHFKYDVLVSTDTKPELFAGTYKDTITLTLADI